MSDETIGAILAGGESRRYGAPKALETVGGRRIIDRVLDALRAVTPDVVLLANEPALFADLSLPTRPDSRPGLGALGGILTGLQWAREDGHAGILAVACDMPFLSPPLLAALLDIASAGEGRPPDVVLPEGRNRRGVEPLCAWYGTRCIEAIEARLDAGDRRMIAFHDDVRVERVPLDRVRRFGDPDTLFLNVNTPADRDRAEALADRLADDEAAPPPDA
jgi:molybdopterin-guanine dinucleotide biosynthesis protein A